MKHNSYSFASLTSLGFTQAPKKYATTIVLQEEALSSLLAHTSDTVRSMVFSVFVSSNSSIRPFSLTALNIIKSNLGVLHSDSDAKFRNEVQSNSKHMIERLRGATALLMREIEGLSFQLRSEHSISPQERQMAQQALEQTTELLRAHADFLESYIEFLLCELIPTASYQRHITALKSISLLLRSGILAPTPHSPPLLVPDNSTVWPCMIDFFNSMSMRLLLDLLMDPFEDVRSSAASILRLASGSDFTKAGLAKELHNNVNGSQQVGGAHTVAAGGDEAFVLTLGAYREEPKEGDSRSLGLLKEFIQRAEGFSKRTGRADYADGVARSVSLQFSLLSSNAERTKLLTQLVESLETNLSIAEEDLALAVLEAPVHGTLSALK